MSNPKDDVAAAWFESSELGRSVGFDHAPEAAKTDMRGLIDKLFRAIEAAGYAVVPRDADIRLTDAGHVVHEVRGAPNDVWHSLLAAVLAASPPLAKET